MINRQDAKSAKGFVGVYSVRFTLSFYLLHLRPHTYVPTLCRKLSLSPDTEVRCYENEPAEPGGD